MRQLLALRVGTQRNEIYFTSISKFDKCVTLDDGESHVFVTVCIGRFVCVLSITQKSTDLGEFFRIDS